MITLVSLNYDGAELKSEPRTIEQTIRHFAAERDIAFAGMYVAAALGNFSTAHVKRRQAFAYQRRIDMLRNNT